MQYIVYAADSGIYNIVYRVCAQDPTRIAEVERKVDDVRARHPSARDEGFGVGGFPKHVSKVALNFRNASTLQPCFLMILGQGTQSFHTVWGRTQQCFHMLLDQETESFHTFGGRTQQRFHMLLGQETQSFHTIWGRTQRCFHILLGEETQSFPHQTLRKFCGLCGNSAETLRKLSGNSAETLRKLCRRFAETSNETLRKQGPKGLRL